MISDMLKMMIEAALAAGAAIETIYENGCDAEIKGDGSPVTIADQQAEAIILDRLAKAYPDIPVLAEEEAAAGRIPTLGARFFLVDPLDGTKSFIQRDGEFTVNIALVEDHAPVIGVVYLPAKATLYYGERGNGAFRKVGADDAIAIAPRIPPQAGLSAIGSRNHAAPGTAERMAALGATDFVPAGSSLKFCRVAEGEADVYPRWGRTMEWDTGAGQAVLEAAGGRVMALDDQDREVGPLRYGKAERGFDNPHFIAWGV